MERLQTVEEYFAIHYPNYDWQIAPRHSSARDMLEAFRGVRQREVYKRYRYFAQRWYANQFMSDFKILAPGFRAQIGGSGMAVINTVIQAAKLSSKSMVVLGKEVYRQVPVAYSLLESFGVKVIRVNSEDLKEIDEAVTQEVAIVHLETIGNGYRLPILDVEGLMRKLWQDEITVIIDGTFTTLELVNPFSIYAGLLKELGKPCLTFVYVESMTKYYRVDEHDSVSGGVVIGRDSFMDEVDKVMAAIGSYQPPACLKLMPANPHQAASRVIHILSRTANKVASWLKQQSWVKEVSYPLDRPAGGVLFFKLVTDDKTTLGRFCDEAIAKAGSYGHAEATIVPMGVFFDGRPGEIRLAVGFDEEPKVTIDKLQAGAQKVFG